MIHGLTEQTWLDLRKQSIGASEIAIVLGVSPYKSAFSLWAEKCELVESAFAESEAMEWGKILEPVVADRYAAVTGRKLIDHGRYALQQHTSIPFLTCTLDREIVEDSKGKATLECKAVGARFESEWEEDAPLLYQLQLQQQLAVMGSEYKWGSLAAVIGGQKFRYKDFERRNDVIAMIEREADQFMWRVKNRRPPEIDGSKATAETVRDMFPREVTEAVELPPEAEDWNEERERAIHEIAAWERKKVLVENQLRLAIGGASYGVLPSGGRYSLKTVNRKEHTVAASSYRQLRRLEK